MLNWARQRNHVLPVIVGSIGAALSVTSIVAFGWFLGLITGLLTVFFVYLELATQWSFRAPPKRKPALVDEAWERMTIDANGCGIAYYLHKGQPGAPLVWICHGWTAGAIRMVHRASTFVERGWHVVLVDLPSHGASDPLPKWSAEQATTLMMASMNELHERRPEMFDSAVCYYGHSIGAFIGLRVSKRREELNEAIHPTSWIFESPMTGYTEIHDETCNILKIPTALRPWILAKTLRHFNAINGPVRSVSKLSDADVPDWGLPTEPTLMVQANPDERLGAVHHQRLMEAMSTGERSTLLTTHLLDDLRHSGSHESSSRKAVVDTWIDERFNHSSSV